MDNDQQEAGWTEITRLYETCFSWKLPNWQEVKMSVSQVEALSTRVPVTLSSGPATVWELSLRLIENQQRAMVQMRLLENNEYQPKSVDLTSRHKEIYGSTQYAWASCVKKGEWFDTNLKLDLMVDGCDGYTNSQKELVLEFKMKTNFKIREQPGMDKIPEQPGMDKFNKKSFNKTIGNLEELLGMESFQNAKIITNDDKEFNVNKFLLSGRCSFFESMFRSGMIEASTNTVKVPDVNGDVMEILIRFWYTGKLADNWNHPDIIENFTYAAGKYQIEEIQELLDDTLGFEDKVKSTIQLLDLARKLDLKKAEKRMVKSIGQRAAAAETSDEIFALFNCSSSGKRKQLPEGPPEKKAPAQKQKRKRLTTS